MALGDTRIVTLGGGFAGVYAALHLERILARREGFEITFVQNSAFLSRKNWNWTSSLVVEPLAKRLPRAFDPLVHSEPFAALPTRPLDRVIVFA